MADVKNKAALKEIAKRWAKGALTHDVMDAFSECLLTDEEVVYVVAELERIANRITKMDAAISTNELVEEYFES